MKEVKCDYCGKLANFVDSAIVYGTSYGMIYYCARCKAWVGVHRGTDTPLGRLADADLRKLRKIAHAFLDRMWRGNRNMTRADVYRWLSEKMGLPVEETHIGLFDLEQCRKAIDFCKNYSLEEENHVTE